MQSICSEHKSNTLGQAKDPSDQYPLPDSYQKQMSRWKGKNRSARFGTCSHQRTSSGLWGPIYLPHELSQSFTETMSFL